MPLNPSSSRAIRIRRVIHDFIRERLTPKLEKLADDDPKRAKLIADYQPTAWLEDAARRVSQIQAVTHLLKAIHPSARGTNLYIPPQSLSARSELGSHILDSTFVVDVTGNAGALDVYKFLKLEIDGRSLLDALLAEDSDALNALDEDSGKARQLRDAFISLVQSSKGRPSSDGLAKQLYWLVDEDPVDDGAYHLLAPLYPTSLVHEVYNRIQEDRFGEESKAARGAR
ncbi:type I-F CRISPR-associated protein Csy1, partial [Cephaloticoccus primus]|uniref:type I-F CRISPR-associated protein Csy1 n=1 Tax=Cephaloticoccus primus TaxID=1548207 RepID=UPI0009EE867B